MMETALVPKDIDDTFRECLYDESEVSDKDKAPDDAIIVEGIVMTVGFHPGRVAKNRDQIREWVKQLPDEFHADKGGGMSFLNMCNDRNGHQWGEHRVMEQLTCLAIAADLGKYCLPREAWSALPGSVPYVVFDTAG
jgi:hypothetical protein